MNADLHMQQDLANSGKGNLFVIFGEPDNDILDAPDDQIQVKINCVVDQEAWELLNSDIFVAFAKPSTGRIAVKVINHLGDEVIKTYKV
jgi:hypothetical protein